MMHGSIWLLVGVSLILFQSANGKLFHKSTETNITGTILCKQGQPATNGTIELYDDDLFKDDLVGSVDLAKAKQGAFKLSGVAMDYSFINPDPDLYIKMVKVCEADCAKMELKGYKKTDDGSIDLDLGPIDISVPDAAGIKKC